MAGNRTREIRYREGTGGVASSRGVRRRTGNPSKWGIVRSLAAAAIGCWESGIGDQESPMGAPEELPCAGVDRIPEDLIGRTGLGDLAGVEEQHLVGDVPGQTHLMGDQQHGAPLRGQIPEHRQDPGSAVHLGNQPAGDHRCLSGVCIAADAAAGPGSPRLRRDHRNQGSVGWKPKRRRQPGGLSQPPATELDGHFRGLRPARTLGPSFRSAG